MLDIILMAIVGIYGIAILDTRDMKNKILYLAIFVGCVVTLLIK